MTYLLRRGETADLPTPDLHASRNFSMIESEASVWTHEGYLARETVPMATGNVQEARGEPP